MGRRRGSIDVDGLGVLLAGLVFVEGLIVWARQTTDRLGQVLSEPRVQVGAVSFAVLALCVWLIFLRPTRCGGPTRKGLPCRKLVRGRWRRCGYHRGAELLRAARGTVAGSELRVATASLYVAVVGLVVSTVGVVATVLQTWFAYQDLGTA
ncbi:MAG: hypothetical protein GEV08_15345 [Acidimicrobiia bacterium]|nr:hypothetical protein [Acidimicrobiia bacterium]